MINRRYYKTEDNRYVYSWVHYPSVWLGISLAVFLLTKVVKKLDYTGIFGYLHFVSLISLIVLAVYELFLVVYGSYVNGGLMRFIDTYSVKRDIRRALVHTMTVDRVKDSNYILVPGIKVRFEDSAIKIIVAKLPGMHNLDSLKEDVNSSLVGKYQGYGIVGAIGSADGTEYIFTLEDVGQNLAFVPKYVEDLIQKPYMLKLQEGLTINLAKSPHLAVWGQSGSGKSTVLFTAIGEFLSSGADLYFIDGKDEFSGLSVFYPPERFVSSSEDVLRLLKEVVSIIDTRQKEVSSELERREVFGLSGYELGLQPVVILADEIGSIVASMDSKAKKMFNSYMTQIAQKGRSVSVFLVVASQSPAVDVLPSGIREQFSTKILLGSSSGDFQRMAFDGQTASSEDVEKFTGFYVSTGKTKSPRRFFVPNLNKYNLKKVDVFKKSYEIGSNRKYQKIV